jgi:hypothetical protein
MTFEECFSRFQVSACRLEGTVPRYADDEERFSLFAAGQPLPERSVRTSPWLAHIAETTAAGRRWSRVYLVDGGQDDAEPWTRFKLAAYQESAAAGEQVWIADRTPVLGQLQTDFWLFDAETDEPFAAIMAYGPGGQFLSARVTTDVAECVAAANLAFAHAVPLAAYLGTAVA